MGVPAAQDWRFPTTDWSQLRQASNHDRQAIGRLVESYSPVLRAYLVHSLRLSEDFADESVQDFIANSLLTGKLFSAADESRGRLRMLLMRSLRNHVLNLRRSDQKHHRNVEEADPAALQSPADEPSRQFDFLWARHLLDETLRRVEQSLTSGNRHHAWEIFRQRLLLPNLHQQEPASYEQLVEQFPFLTPLQACNAMVTAKRAFERHLHEVIAETVSSPDDIQAEIHDLIRSLSDPSFPG